MPEAKWTPPTETKPAPTETTPAQTEPALMQILHELGKLSAKAEDHTVVLGKLEGWLQTAQSQQIERALETKEAKPLETKQTGPATATEPGRTFICPNCGWKSSF